MIQINQLKLPLKHSPADLEKQIRKALRLQGSMEIQYEIAKRSVDARKKPELYLVYSVLVTLKDEDRVIKRAKNPNVIKASRVLYRIPKGNASAFTGRPVVIGAGPAGLFAAYLLTEAGIPPLVLERGKSVEQRQQDVLKFWETGVLDPSSNVQFGEGGAGTFSDGKLNTVVKDPQGRVRFVLETFVRFGASPDILIDQKPHIGTDVLSFVIANMRNYLLSKGCEFSFNTCVTDFVIDKGRLKALICGSRIIETECAVLAIGHSARDTFEKLYHKQIYMEPKNFAVGFRVEHPQSMINRFMYGDMGGQMPASPYKVTSNFPNGRGVYSFCMCPGGYVVNSSSEEGGTVVNGMSYSGRNGRNANSAIIVSVTTKDFGGDDALSGLRFQRRLEQENYKLGRGAIPQQLFGDFRSRKGSVEYGDYRSETKGAAVLSCLNGLMNEDMETSFIQGMEHFARIIPGFDRYDGILSGMETRTSSPIKILRDDSLQSGSCQGLFPCGEGAGYAGGITSAAVDGIRVAEAILQKSLKEVTNC